MGGGGLLIRAGVRGGRDEGWQRLREAGCRSFDTQAIGTADISYSRYFCTSLFGTPAISDSNRL